MNVLAIDQGTSSTKALVVAPDGRVLGVGSAPVAVEVRGGGAVEQDPQAVLDSVLAAGRDALAAAGVPVATVGLANQGETVLRWDPRSGRPLGPAISWQDSRAAVVTDGLRPAAERLEALTGLPLDPYFAAPKMAWLQRRDGTDGVVTTLDVWLNQQLTGRAVTDAATASRTLLLDLDAVAWSPEACELFGLPAEQPEIVGCAEPVGETTAFGPSLPLTGLIVDQQAALLAESCFAVGDAKCTYGTGAFLLANAGAAAPRSTAGLAACVAWQAGGETAFCLDGQVFAAGAAVSWLQQVGLLRDARELDEIVPAGMPDGAAELFVPALSGLGAPDWAPHARAGWSGLSLATSRADLVAAAVWGIAAQVALLAEAVGRDLGRPLTSLRVDGGLSRSAALMQAQADLLQLPVVRYPHADATALGVAALARLGAGGAATPGDAVVPWEPAEVYEPRLAAHHAEEHLERFRRAGAALADLAAPAPRAAR